MVSEHCMINGERCSECCKVLTVNVDGEFRRLAKDYRRNGYPENYNSKTNDIHLLKQISRRRAKKINPHVVKRAGGRTDYWTCRNYKDGKCSDYENRPFMCSKYPFYGRTVDEWKASDEFKRGAYYHEECTYYINL